MPRSTPRGSRAGWRADEQAGAAVTGTVPRRLRSAMVGGGRGAFIGAVHRHAMALDGEIELVAGALSSDAARAQASGRELRLAEDRNHGSWQALLSDELKRPVDERIDFVVIVTPNHVHHAVAKAFAEAGIHVVCDKPLANTSAQADELVRIARERDIVFAVTYNYIGYPLVRQARDMVRAGAIGAIRKVTVEYHQGWLVTALEREGNKQASWRTDPARSGAAGAIGDIGTHAENLVATVTGLHVQRVCADLGSVVPGRTLDDDASLLLRLQGDVRGVMLASQVAGGCENDLRLRVFGSTGTLDWRQEEPNTLAHAPIDGPRRQLTRGSPWLSQAARASTRLPPGHPEGFVEAFANVYLGLAADIRARHEGRRIAAHEREYADVSDGARGVRFIESVVASAQSQRKWTEVTEATA
jgi:predicted dehydrogenase